MQSNVGSTVKWLNKCCDTTHKLLIEPINGSADDFNIIMVLILRLIFSMSFNSEILLTMFADKQQVLRRIGER